MHLFGIRVFEDQQTAGRRVKRNGTQRLRSLAAVMLTLTAGVPSGFSQQQTGGVNLLSAKEVQPGVLVFRIRDQTPEGVEALHRPPDSPMRAPGGVQPTSGRPFNR